MMYKNVHPYRYRDVQNTYGGGAPNANVAVPKFELAPDGTPLFPILSTDPKFGYPAHQCRGDQKWKGK
nr:hypothetical protein [Bacteroidota bacterium]